MLSFNAAMRSMTSPDGGAGRRDGDLLPLGFLVEHRLHALSVLVAVSLGLEFPRR